MEYPCDLGMNLWQFRVTLGGRGWWAMGDLGEKQKLERKPKEAALNFIHLFSMEKAQKERNSSMESRIK